MLLNFYSFQFRPRYVAYNVLVSKYVKVIHFTVLRLDLFEEIMNLYFKISHLIILFCSCYINYITYNCVQLRKLSCITTQNANKDTDKIQIATKCFY